MGPHFGRERLSRCEVLEIFYHRNINRLCTCFPRPICDQMYDSFAPNIESSKERSELV